jgi:hypothetical protein
MEGEFIMLVEDAERCSRSSTIWMDADAPIPRRPRTQPAAEEMALKIGLNIAPKGSTKKMIGMRARRRRKKKGKKEG